MAASWKGCHSVGAQGAAGVSTGDPKHAPSPPPAWYRSGGPHGLEGCFCFQRHPSPQQRNSPFPAASPQCTPEAQRARSAVRLAVAPGKSIEGAFPGRCRFASVGGGGQPRGAASGRGTRWRPPGARRRRLHRDLKGSRAEGSSNDSRCDPSASRLSDGNDVVSLVVVVGGIYSCASAVGCRGRELHSLWCLSASSRRIPSKPSRPLARSKGARTLGVGVVSLRRQSWTPFRVLPPSPGGVRVAHRGRRRVCGAAARLGGYEVRTPGDRRRHPALRENAGREAPKSADASQIPRLRARWRWPGELDQLVKCLPHKHEELRREH